MDVYGYQTYQYNQSDELAKQMFAQQALATSYNRAIPEPHNMPAPSGAPWNAHGLPWGMQTPPHLVQFTGQPINPEIQTTPILHCKRKSLDVEPVIPAKQLITDEKMAAHLSGLHISSDYRPHLSATEEVMDVSMEASSSDIFNKLKGHKLVLSEEIKKLKDEPLLPAAIIERLEKPSMSIVLWKPREEILGKLPEEKTDDEEQAQRKGVLVPEHTGTMEIEM